MNPNTPIRTVLIEEQRLLLESLSTRIQRIPDFQIAGTASGSVDGLEVIRRTEPAVVMLGIVNRDRSGFDIAAEATRRQRNLKIVFLTSRLTDVFLARAMRLGADGYLLKSEPLEFVIQCLRRVARGECCFSREVQQRLEYDARRRRYTVNSENRLASLTNRQLEVLTRLSRGESVKEVAHGMHLSVKSIDSHKYRIMHKLGIHDRVHLARFAIREGLLQP